MKAFIETIGCKLNQFESQALAEILQKENIQITASMEEADCVIVNSCSVTNQADVKSRQMMRRARKLGKIVVATGCYATTDFDSLDESDFADIIVKNDSKFSIPELLLSKFSLNHFIKEAGSSDEFPIVHQFERTRAFLKIQDGCDKFCSYCKIPHARGRSRSLDPETIIRFTQELIQNGYKEIVLTGVNISDYHYNEIRLTDVVQQTLGLAGNFRVRLSSIQPDEFDIRMLDFLCHPKFASHFHLSLQSGSSSVLHRMERNYTAQYFLQLLEKIRSADPSCGITTDIIVGFPGESNTEFDETLSLVKQSRFTRVHSFPYSPRSHTKAARLPDLDGGIKRERIKQLEETATESAKEFIKEQVLFKSWPVLAESKEGKFSTGHTSNYLKVYTERDWTANEWVKANPIHVEIDKSGIILRE